MKALILAAGLGTRLLPFTRITPKPLFPIAGRPLLDIHIHALRNAGCEAIIVNTHHLAEAIEAFIAERHYPIPVHSRYEPEILDRKSEAAGEKTGAISSMSREKLIARCDELTQQLKNS